MIGQTISHYKILEKLGEGGMGVVYKAQDTNLDRLVALKFLPPHLSASDQDKARFTQEAKAAAALNHPNICTIHGIEKHVIPEGAGQTFIVMEFVEGQTMRQKGGNVPLKQAMEIGVQLADGLAAAHEKGIVHRDLKPENIMIQKDGRVKIMDFGLAKLKGVSRLTKAGSTVGTAGYMSPEQVQGLDTDHRTDIFSLGVILYELFVGSSPFKGVHETAINYEIVNVDTPPPSAINSEISPELDSVVLECLEKEARERTQSASQVAVDLKRYRRESSRQRVSRIVPAHSVSGPDVSSSSQPRISLSHVPTALRLIATLVAGIALGWATFLLTAEDKANEPRYANISAVSAAGQQIYTSDIPSFALSPDGQFIAYTLAESGASKIFLRALNSFQATFIKGTENGNAPFFSPDGKWIGFAADGKIKKVLISGGTVEVVADAPGFRGASWGPDDRIVLSSEFASALVSVSASGGDIRTISRLDTTTRERTHRWPQVLPDGKWVLYTIGDQSSPNSYVDAPLALQSLETGERHILEIRGEMGFYVEPGYIIVARDGSLYAAPFSLKERRITQPLTTVISDVSGDVGSGVVYFSVSASGDLMYLPGSANPQFGLVWVTRDGQTTPLALPPQTYVAPRISPDGSKLAVVVGTPGTNDNDIWIYDFRTTAFNRFTFEKRMSSVAWSRDGRNLYYASTLTGMDGVMVKPVDGSSAATLMIRSGGDPVSVSPRGDLLILNTVTVEGDITVVDLAKGDRQPRNVIATPRFEYGGHISPDGRYILYYSNEPGTPEVFVATYPDLKGKWQISRNGGTLPIWSPDGKEIFYVNNVGRMMSVPIQRDPTFLPGAPRELFDMTQMFTPNMPLANWDIAPDGKRFIFVRTMNFVAASSSFNVVFRWIDVLKQLSEKK